MQFEVIISGHDIGATSYIGNNEGKARAVYAECRAYPRPFRTVFLVKDGRPIELTRWDHLSTETSMIVPPAR